MSGFEEGLLRLVTSSSQIGMIVIDRAFRYLFANEGYAALIGTSVTAIVGRSIPEVLGARWEAMRERSVAAVESLPADADELKPFEEKWERLRARLERAFAGESVKFEVTIPALTGVSAARTFEVLCEVREPAAAEPAMIAVFVDITARRGAEKASLQIEHDFRKLAETLPQLVWTCAADGACDYVSPQFTRYTGTVEAECHGLGWLESVHPEDRDRATDEWQRVLASADDVDVELRMRRADGVYRWFVIRAVAVRGNRGTVRRWIGSCTDIEDQLKLTQELCAERNVLRTVIDALPDAVFTKDLDGRIVVANRAAGPPLGYPDHRDLVGKTAFELLPPAAAERAKQHDATVLAGNEIRVQQHLAAAGTREPRDLDTIKVPLRDAAGAVCGLVCIVRDITEFRQAELALRESEQRLRLFFEHAPAALAMFDRDMRYLAVSERWKVDYGLSDRDLIGQSHYDVFPEITDSWRKIHRRCLAGEVIESPAESFERADGRRQWLHWEVRPWRRLDGSVGGVAIFTEDVTNVKKAHDELGRVNADLERSVQRLARANRDLTAQTQESEAFVHSVSHDLRSPLVNLQGFSAELKRAVDAQRALLARGLDAETHRELASILDTPVARSIHFIQAAVARLGSIIDALLRLSRAGRVVYRRQTVDVSALVARVVDALDGTITGRGAAVEIGPLAPLQTDPAALEQVFANLIGNALNYLDERRPGRITVGSTTGAAGEREYFVRDNGMGIPASGLSKLFKPFLRLHPRAAAGEGMGLAIVQRVVGSLGGTIRCESIAGEGSTFFVTMPAEADPLAECGPEKRLRS